MLIALARLGGDKGAYEPPSAQLAARLYEDDEELGPEVEPW